MKRTKTSPPRQIRCVRCRRLTPPYNIVNYGSVEQGYQQICGQCLNAEAAKSDGLIEFEDARFEPVSLIDCAGKSHEFHFRTRLFGPGVALDAFELCDGHPAGYRFQIIGQPQDDLLVLLGRLVEKMRRALAVKHLRRGTLGLEIVDRRVRGLIESDLASEGTVPLVVVDGREVAWEELGRMLMTFEGFQFKLEIRDISEEL